MGAKQGRMDGVEGGEQQPCQWRRGPTGGLDSLRQNLLKRPLDCVLIFGISSNLPAAGDRCSF